MNLLKSYFSKIFVFILAFSALLMPAYAADHLDTQFLIDNNRNDARLTDLFAFIRGDPGEENLVIIVDSIAPQGLTSDQFKYSPDVTYKVFIDKNSQVADQANPLVGGLLGDAGGKVLSPGNINEDIVLTYRFDEMGDPILHVSGIKKGIPVKTFFGLREDPFLVRSFNDNDVASAVFEIPLEAVIQESSNPILIWASSKVEELEGQVNELVGRGLYTQFEVFGIVPTDLNILHPRQHQKKTGLEPAVMILDISKPVKWPNGRELTDDELLRTVFANLGVPEDAIADPNTERNFLSEFPYLGPPHSEQ